MSLVLPRLVAVDPVQSPQVPAPAPFEVMWQAEAGTTGTPQMTAGAAAVFVADGQGVRAFGAADGHQLWTVRLPVAGRIAAGQEVLLLHADGSLRALDQKTGAERWSAAVEPSSGITVTPAGVFAATGAVLRSWQADGTPRWQRTVTAPASAAPALDGATLFAALTDSTLVAVDASDGTLRWQHAIPSGPRAMTAAAGRAYFGGADGAVYAFDADGSIDADWRFDVRAETIDAPVVDDRCVYVALMDNSIRAFKRDIGNLCWLTPLTMRPAAAPALAGTSLAILTATGSLVALDKKTGRVVGEPVTAPGAAPESRPRLLGSAVGDDGTIFTLTIASGAAPTVTAFKRKAGG